MNAQHLGEPCESCGVNLVYPIGPAGERIVLEMRHQDGRTQRMPVHTPERCRAERGVS